MSTRAALALSGVAACAGADGTVDASGDCTRDEQCLPGTCQFGVCVTGAPRALALDLWIHPPAARAELAPLLVGAAPVRTGAPLPDYALRPPVAVQGVVLFNAVGAGIGTPVACEVRFTQVNLAFGSGTPITARTDNDGVYQIDVPVGVYDVVLDPDRGDVAAFTTRDVVVAGAGEFQPFTMPAPEQYVVVSGVVERDRGAIEPIEGALVRAMTADGSLESTSDVSDASGRYLLFTPPTDQPWVFTTRPAAGFDDVPAATFVATPVPAGAANVEVDLRFGPSAPLAFPRFQVQTVEGTPVVDAVVALRWEVAPSASTARGPGVEEGVEAVLVDGDFLSETGGLFVAPVYSERVEVRAAALAPDLGLAPARALLVATAEDPEPLFVDARRTVAGAVVDAGGVLQAGVRLHAQFVHTASSPVDEYPVPASLYDAVATTDEAGTFALSLAPGSWRIDVVPPLATGLPRRVLRVDVTRSGSEPLNVVLGAGGVAAGRVLDELSAPLAGALVVASVDGVTLAETMTDHDGVYRLVLASE